jgi:hypothetical protein
MVLSGTGSGGLSELKGHVNDNQVYFGVLRVRAVDDHGSKRAKFVFITLTGAGVVRTSLMATWLDENSLCYIYSSRRCVELELPHINRKSNGFSTVITFKYTPLVVTISKNNPSLNFCMAVPELTSLKPTNSTEHLCLSSAFFSL